MPKASLADVKKLVVEAYIPFANIKRAIPWPYEPGRMENDAEHSFAIALVGLTVGPTLGLDPYKIAYYATVHDVLELRAGDTSVWDEEGAKTKAKREAAAFIQMKAEFSQLPALLAAVEAYENLQDEEAQFVYALDKILPSIIVMHDNGRFWKENGIRFEQHLKKVEEIRPKIAKHTIVLAWYDEILAEIEKQKDSYFA